MHRLAEVGRVESSGGARPGGERQKEREVYEQRARQHTRIAFGHRLAGFSGSRGGARREAGHSEAAHGGGEEAAGAGRLESESHA